MREQYDTLVCAPHLGCVAARCAGWAVHVAGVAAVSLMLTETCCASVAQTLVWRGRERCVTYFCIVDEASAQLGVYLLNVGTADAWVRGDIRSRAIRGIAMRRNRDVPRSLYRGCMDWRCQPPC